MPLSSNLSAQGKTIERSHPDIYGQQHPLESDELITQSIFQFDAKVAELSEKKRTSVSRAEVACPELLTNDLKLLFLRCEVFNAELAAKRYAKYWDNRLHIMGDEHAFQPLTLENSALQDEGVMAFINTGVANIIRREGQRTLLYLDTSKTDPTLYSRESALRATLYLFHALVEDELVQRQGVIILMYNEYMTSRNRDPPLTKSIFQLFKGALPMRLSAIHCFKVPPVYSFVLTFLLVLIGSYLRKRVILHEDDTAKYLKKLEDVYDIAREDLPSDMGGVNKLDIENWILSRERERRWLSIDDM